MSKVFQGTIKYFVQMENTGFKLESRIFHLHKILDSIFFVFSYNSSVHHQATIFIQFYSLSGLNR